MARTHVPAWDEPIHITMEQLREMMRDTLVQLQGDADKAGDVEDAEYYQGGVDVLNSLLLSMTFPRCEADARECVHGNQVWLGHECGDCASTGYEWADAS
jgi:hypothetical protein